jgi:YVTN family beta-propeller protein
MVEVGEEPEGVLTSIDGKTVYVTSEVANTVHAVDTSNWELKANIVVGKRPRRFAMTPDQQELWVTSELDSSISIIDTSTLKIKDVIKFAPKGFRAEDVTPVGISMTADGKTAYVTMGRANRVAVVSTKGREIEDYILVGERAWNAALNKDESLLLVVNGLSDDLSIIDTKKRKVIKSVPVGRVPYMAVIDN